MRPACADLRLPADWDLRASFAGDVTGEGRPQCVLLVWRPWRDWHTRRWAATPGPTATFRDARGDSAHLIVVEPLGQGRYRERWAGSALARPAVALRLLDLEGDGVLEVGVLEGSYPAGRDGTASHAALWRWSGFGFHLVRRSAAGRYHQLEVAGSGRQALLYR
nr:hypothetical protein [Deinobacterium chartae]